MKRKRSKRKGKLRNSHIRLLLETIAIIVAFVAWFLQWGLSEKMNHATEDFKRLIKEANNVHTQISRDISIKNEAAMTRALLNNDSLPDDISAKSLYTWQSPEVRYCWLKEFNNDCDEIVHIVEIVLNTEEQYNLKSNPYSISIEKELDRFRKNVQSDFEINRAFADIPIPDPNKIPPEKAFRYSSQVSDILYKMEEPINYTIDALNKKKSLNSNIYRVVFGISFISLILSKIIDWLYALKEH